ncbi:MAG: CHAT domain-containing protein, partial [Flavobacterium sp.]|nr:CHAT domain-containing protein [Flavobacterium sp.]
LQNNNPTLALRYFEKEKAIFLENKTFEARDLAKLYVDEANIHIANNDAENALLSYSNALQTLLPFEKRNRLPKTTSLYPENTFLAIFDGFANVENKIDKKLAWYNLSFYVSELISDNLVSQEAQIIHQIENRKRTEKCIDLLWNAYQKNKDFRLLESAFQFAEKSKNTVLKERNYQKSLVEQFPKNKALQLQNQLLSKQESLINEYIRLQITQENETRLVALNTELVSLSIQLKNVNEKINHHFKNKTAALFSLETLEQKLKKENAQLVYYFWAKEKVYSFHFKNQKATWRKIDFNTENSLILSQFIHFFDDANAINKNVSAFSSTANNLHQLLGFNQVEKNKNLIIIPDGLLHFVAFDALVTQKTTSTNFSKIPFLVYQNKIAYQTNVSFYLNDSKTKKNDKIIGFFPVFKNTNAYLEYSIDEAKALEKNKATLFMNETANRENFKQNVSQYSILHLSTHGTSGSFSSPATLVFYDDVLLVNELYSLKKCNPDLVVLSACETGIGKLQKGEGAISIARAFQYAGAKNVLFSLWKINDYATSEIMTGFYDNYASNYSFLNLITFLKLIIWKTKIFPMLKNHHIIGVLLCIMGPLIRLKLTIFITMYLESFY